MLQYLSPAESALLPCACILPASLEAVSLLLLALPGASLADPEARLDVQLSLHFINKAAESVLLMSLRVQLKIARGRSAMNDL